MTAFVSKGGGAVDRSDTESVTQNNASAFTTTWG